MSDLIDLYIYISDEDFDFVELYKITKEWEGKIYKNGEWAPYDGVFKYYPDPSPNQYVSEDEAQVIMMKLDDRDRI